MAFFKSIFGGGVDPKRLCKKLDDDLIVLQDHINSQSGSDGTAASASASGESKAAAEVPAKVQATLEHLHKQLEKMRGAFFGNPPDNSVDQPTCYKIGVQVVEKDLFKRLVLALPSLGFETRKLVEMNFIALNHNDYGGFSSRYLTDVKNRTLLDFLVRGYERDGDVALICGGMLRDCLSRPTLAKSLVTRQNFDLFMNKYLHLRNFDVSSDATATFKAMVDSDVFADYLKDEANYEHFFQLYHSKLVLAVKEYVTMREALKLLGEILLKRSNFDIMMRYISSKPNLKVVMTAMASKSDQIKFEAFHVFKVFVANPQKAPAVHSLLYANRNMLVQYLQTYHKDKADDPQFAEERTLLIATLSALQPLPAASGSASATPPAAP